MKVPHIFDYTEIHFYLLEIYKYRKTLEKKFSYEKWAKELSMKSRSYLRFVVTGKRALAESLISSFIQNLNLKEEEENYFSLLVKYQTCKTPQSRKSISQQLIQSQQRRVEFLQIEDTGAFISDPATPIVFTFLTDKSGSSSIKEIAQICFLEELRVHKILNQLFLLKLLELNIDDNGEIGYRTLNPVFKISDQPSSEFLARYHAEGIQQASAAVTLPFTERRFRSLLFTLSEAEMDQAQGLINEFAFKVMQSFTNKTHELAKVYRLNLQLFPVSSAYNASEND